MRAVEQAHTRQESVCIREISLPEVIGVDEVTSEIGETKIQIS